MRNIKNKSNIFLLVIVTTIFIVSGCSAQNVSENEHNKLLEENQKLTSQLALAQENINTKVTGSFVATVRQLSPDYVLDNSTLTMAVLTCFQSGPFMVHVGEDMAKELTVGETYYFEIDENEIGEISKNEFEKGCPSIEVAFYLYNLHIKSFREPYEHEYGLASININYKKINE